MPEASKDYPGNWREFHAWFATEQACIEYLEKVRWPEGVVCPSCQEHAEPYRVSRSRLVCRACRYQCTVTAGTIFEKTRTPLQVWLAAAWYITNQKQGVSALGLQRVLGLGSYQTAWTMLHRFRRAMVRSGRDKLRGTVEVDETYVAITDRSVGRSIKGKKSRTGHAFVAVAVEIIEPKGFGRIRLQRLERDSAEHVEPFIKGAVAPGSIVKTDESAAYRSLASLGYDHRRSVMLGADVPAHVSLAGVHRVAALLQRWLMGTHHGAVQPRHLDAYLDEFAFRFNRRKSGSRGMLFYRLMQQALETAPLTYESVVSAQPKTTQRQVELSG